jgi:hypothetical protein
MSKFQLDSLKKFQDRVLAIINQIMDELLCDDRACRAFRVKFPEEVLQESLGYLFYKNYTYAYLRIKLY